MIARVDGKSGWGLPAHEMEVCPVLTGAHLPVETSVDGSMSIGDEFVVTYLWLPLPQEAINNPLLRGRIPICDLLA